ncbi:MAG: hypothetical protein P8179_02990 [Candidatus Thiodiazotropha sp.]|jgi:ketopantoate hydroxymethyltransferase
MMKKYITIKLGLSPHPLWFVENFLHSGRNIKEALKADMAAVKQGVFPAAEHSFK